jgi:Na+/H+-dicarboxylate symporter
MKTGEAAGSLGKYVMVVLGGNILQFFVILPIFLICRKINPLKIFRGMLPAVLMALFTNSYIETLPKTIASAAVSRRRLRRAGAILPLVVRTSPCGSSARSPHS